MFQWLSNNTIMPTPKSTIFHFPSRLPASNRLNAQGQRCHIQQEQILSTFAAQNTGLHGSTIGHCFVRVDATVGLLAIEEVLQKSDVGSKKVEWKLLQESN